MLEQLLLFELMLLLELETGVVVACHVVAVGAHGALAPDQPGPNGPCHVIVPQLRDHYLPIPPDKLGAESVIGSCIVFHNGHLFRHAVVEPFGRGLEWLVVVLR